MQEEDAGVINVLYLCVASEREESEIPPKLKLKGKTKGGREFFLWWW